MATVRRPSSVAARMMRMAISLRFRARSFFISEKLRLALILERLLDALGEQVHESLRVIAVHPAGNFTMFVHDDGRGKRSDAQHPRQAIFEIHGIVPLIFLQEWRHQLRILIRADGHESHTWIA